MSRKCKCCCCQCGYSPAPVAGAGICGAGRYGAGYGCGCGGFDPCKLALFLLILKRACIIDHETATILIFLFMLCCKGFASRGLCAC